jgi:hypothetical protein
MKITLLLILLVTNINAQEVAPKANPNVYIDKDGDTITILDAEAHKMLKSTKEIAVSNIYDNSTDLKKEKIKDEKTKEKSVTEVPVESQKSPPKDK